jgi:hypothetical protein
LGWGTLIHNRGYRKRLNIHINHPVEDGNVAIIGAELFRRTGARWLLIGGSSKRALKPGLKADLAGAKISVFQKWHEELSDLTSIAISLHGYNPNAYPFPLNASEIVISNGRTSDDQWGISQISLTLRDSLRSGGYGAALAMLDSGFARLAGGRNPQGIFSNDSTGFGHWLNCELSSKVRYNEREYLKFIGLADRALDLTGRPVSQQINNAFGLVSPRVLRIDANKKLLFPPAENEKYRIISFSPGETKNDTIDLLFGDWVGGGAGNGSIARIMEYDTSNGSIHGQSGRRGQHHGNTLTTVVSNSPRNRASGIRSVGHEPRDSSLAGEDDVNAREPIQVHRIPLQPVLAATVSPGYLPVATPFEWGGIIPEGFSPQLLTYATSPSPVTRADMSGLSKFLIPLLKNSYQPGKQHFVGVDMTDMLVSEIARLVSEYEVEGREIGLMAEQSETGDYYLRLFPEIAESSMRSNLP